MDNVNEIAENDLLELKKIAKFFVDKSKPIVFLFLSSEGKGPAILMKNMSRMKVTRLKESSRQLAFVYFKKIGVKADYFEKLENITGSAFKYLTEITTIYPSLPQEQFLQVAKGKVHVKIEPEVLEWLNQKIYPEIIQVFQDWFYTNIQIQ